MFQLTYISVTVIVNLNHTACDSGVGTDSVGISAIIDDRNLLLSSVNVASSQKNIKTYRRGSTDRRSSNSARRSRNCHHHHHQSHQRQLQQQASAAGIAVVRDLLHSIISRHAHAASLHADNSIAYQRKWHTRRHRGTEGDMPPQ